MTVSLEIFTLVACPSHMVLLKFYKEYKTRRIQIGHSLDVFPLQTERRKVMKGLYSAGPQDSVYV